MTFTPLLYYLLGGILSGWLLLEFVIWRTGSLAKRKKEILDMQLEYARLEDKALRSQMNPHFIFNSLNSIKLLVQENKNEKAIYYLTTFTKLLRGMLNNADKSTITLHEELETCKLYLSLEALRFNDEFSYSINTDPALDLKSIEIPALILQPFVENAIWHGLMPKKGNRILHISVTQFQNWVTCRIDDNGIGRKASLQVNTNQNHKSKGLELTHNRMHINDKLNEKESRVIIHDKYSTEGEPLGTRVDIMFDLNE
jgi:LytS/YehU family sensor histidine kinase